MTGWLLAFVAPILCGSTVASISCSRFPDNDAYYQFQRVLVSRQALRLGMGFPFALAALGGARHLCRTAGGRHRRSATRAHGGELCVVRAGRDGAVDTGLLVEGRAAALALGARLSGMLAHQPRRCGPTRFSSKATSSGCMNT